MRHKFLVLTAKKWLKSVYIYRSYRKLKMGVSLFWTTPYDKATIQNPRHAKIFGWPKSLP